jgi:hypothetical protein
MTRTLFRAVAGLAGAGLALFAAGVYVRHPAALGLWIWPRTPALGCVFVAAMLAGAAAPLVWIGVSGRLAAVRAAMLAGVVANTGIALRLLVRHALPGNERYLPFAALFAFGTVLAAGVLLAARRLPDRDDRPLSPAVRAAFLLFAAILLPVGAAMALNIPRVFPIPLTPDMAAVYGWFFLGSFAYYAHAAGRPSADNAAGPLLSFLVYDLLMLPPYLAYARTPHPGFETSLTVYLVVLVASALFCLYALTGSRFKVPGSRF